MTVQVFATSEPVGDSLVLPSGRELFETLGPDNEARPRAIEFTELVGTLFDQVRHSLNIDCTAEITVSGSLTVRGKGELKLLIFNVGGDAESQTTATVKITAQLVRESF